MTKVERGRWHTEYALFEDRRSDGLGWANVYSSSDEAQVKAKKAMVDEGAPGLPGHRVTHANHSHGRYPTEIRQRQVFLGEWQPFDESETP